MPTVALESSFLEALTRLPQAQQKKVREFTKKFLIDPTAASINYEKINGMKDEKVRTVRIGIDYRAIILHPEKGDVHVLVWVDHHDEAMAWAKHKTFPINPVTGAIQVINFSELLPPPPPTPIGEPALFDQLGDDVILSFGVPEVLLPAVRALRAKDDLLAFAKFLPEESSEALSWLAEGLPPEEVRANYATTERREQVDTTDFEEALKHPDTQRRFVTVESEQDLEAMLNAPLEKWRVFLHPSQRKLVCKNFKGAARVLGGAGTGKTVVAMHRAKHLAAEVFNSPSDRILFVTFTANLAKNVEQNLRTLCPDEMKRIEAIHLHSWAVRFLRDQGSRFDIVSDTEAAECWREAVDAQDELPWDSGFLRKEWNQVVQAHGLESADEYMKVSRVGRGKTLSRADRARIWKVFEAYRRRLQELGKVEWLDVMRATRRYLESRPGSLPYRAVVVDEAQDLHAEELRLIRSVVPEGPNDLFIVGDAHQRIYDRKVVLSQCGINVRGRSSKLNINYRTTEQIRSWGMGLLRGVEVDDLDAGADSQAGYQSLLSGPAPELRHFKTLGEEQAFLRRTLEELVAERPAEEICLVTVKKSALANEYGKVLRDAGIPHVVLDKDDDGAAKGVRLATMHRVKGLEFPCIIMAGINDGVIPIHHLSLSVDPVMQKEHEARERSLLYVAATRARDRLIVTSYGKPSTYAT
jgi:superfamily I DNA/RNA helicase